MTNPLLTQTLPTVIGAGVVSRSVDTLFGDKKSRTVGRTSKGTSKGTKKKTGGGKMAKMSRAARSAAAKKGWRTRKAKKRKRSR